MVTPAEPHPQRAGIGPDDHEEASNFWSAGTLA